MFFVKLHFTKNLAMLVKKSDKSDVFDGYLSNSRRAAAPSSSPVRRFCLCIHFKFFDSLEYCGYYTQYPQYSSHQTQPRAEYPGQCSAKYQSADGSPNSGRKICAGGSREANCMGETDAA